MKDTLENRNFRRSRCDIREEQDQIVMRLEMPGVNKSGLDINIEGDKLIIEGTRTVDAGTGKSLIREINQNDFRMEYTIDETIDRNSIEASLNQGILLLTLGLSEEVKPRKIEVISK